jgi:DNA-binding IclR family transcriptional regulator
MAEHTFEELSKKNVTQLREIAEGVQHEAVQGYKTMHKEDLVRALCTAFGVEARAKKQVVGIDKAGVKGQIKELKAKRAKALEAHDHAELKKVRRKIHRLKRKMRKFIA